MIQFSNPIAGCMRWGKWGENFSTTDYRKMIESCIEIGTTTFDHADIYGHYTTETEFGNALKEDSALRSKIQIISKCGIQMLSENRPLHQIKSYNTSKEHIIQSVENSLQNFGTDYLDVLLIHRPDPLMNPTEIAEAVEQLKQQGKIVQFGVSNFLPHHVNMLQAFTEIEINQIEISIFHLDSFTDGTLDHCIENNILPMAWSPLGGGKLIDENNPRSQNIQATASLLATKYNTGIDEILIAFLLKHPAQIIPVLGTTKIERIKKAQAAKSIPLNSEDWFKLYTASTGKDVA